MTSLNVFRFFDLARELRDSVYSHAAASRDQPKTIQAAPEVNITGCSLLITNFCLVSKQFRCEYEEEVLRTARIELDFDVTCSPGITQQLLMGMSTSYRQHVRDVELCLTGCISSPSDPALLLHLHRELPALIRGLPALCRFSLVLDTTEYHIDYFLQHDVELRALLSMPLPAIQQATHATSKPIAVTRSLLIRGDALSFPPIPSIDPLIVIDDESDVWYLREFLQDTGRNYITYRATLATTEPAWFGLDLMTERSGFRGWAEAKAAREESVRGYEELLGEDSDDN